jgi:2-iminobutanoate/2-iminopropanoate deaminase
VSENAVLAHNPDGVWSIPESFRPIYSHAVELRRTARLLFVSGQIGVAPDGSVDAHFEAQCEIAMTNVESLLGAGAMNHTNILKLVFYLTRAADLPMLGEVRRRRWASSMPPAVTTLIVAALARPELLVEIDVIAASMS